MKNTLMVINMNQDNAHDFNHTFKKANVAACTYSSPIKHPLDPINAAQAQFQLLSNIDWNWWVCHSDDGEVYPSELRSSCFKGDVEPGHPYLPTDGSMDSLIEEIVNHRVPRFILMLDAPDNISDESILDCLKSWDFIESENIRSHFLLKHFNSLIDYVFNHLPAHTTVAFFPCHPKINSCRL